MSVVLDHVTKRFDTGKSADGCVIAVDDVSLEMEQNGFLSILGPSGCGKTTILRMIAGFERPTEGEIHCGGATVTRPGADRVVVFQRPWLYPWLNVHDNIAFGLKLGGSKIDHDKVNQIISTVGLDGFARRAPHELSGGMQQRAALARALVMSPQVLLMDEPFGALDAQTRRLMQDFLLDLWGEIKATVIFITHDIEEAILLGDRLVVMTPRPGRVALDQRIDLPRPRDETTALEPHFIELRRQALETLIDAHSHSTTAVTSGGDRGRKWA